MIEVYCDGGSRGNPGHSAFGFVVTDDDKIIKEGAGYIGIATNNVAEYTAIVEALNWLEGYYRGADIKFYLDSKLAVSQLSGLYKVKNSNIREFVLKIRSLETSFGQISYRLIPRRENSRADALVNQVLDKRTKNYI